jgi:hypothetical protein
LLHFANGHFYGTFEKLVEAAGIEPAPEDFA